MLHQLWTRWKALGEFLGNLLARVVLSVFYFTIFVPFAVGTRLFSDPLDTKSAPSSYWFARSTPPVTIEEAKGQS